MTPATLLLHDERREWVAYLREEAAGHGALLRRALRSRTQVCHLPGRGGRRGRVRVAARSRVSRGDPEPDPLTLRYALNLNPSSKLEQALTNNTGVLPVRGVRRGRVREGSGACRCARRGARGSRLVTAEDGVSAASVVFTRFSATRRRAPRPRAPPAAAARLRGSRVATPRVLSSDLPPPVSSDRVRLRSEVQW